ncbi:MAG: flagellin FliC5 [Lachnospiraceae bacterium]|nr:flagellin FliC5 [Lachnospiraceae bacterium]
MSGISGISSTSPYVYGQIASGNRLTSAANGAAELAITENEKAQITGINTGTKNLNDGLSLLRTSDSAQGSITNSLQRMRELALRATSSILNPTNRASIQQEIEQLKKEINRVSGQTTFNGIQLLDGSQTEGVKLVSDAYGGEINVNSSINSTIDALGLADFDVTKSFDIGAIDKALDQVTGDRTTLGAQYNKLEYAINYNGYASENLTASMSRMGDADIEETLMKLKHQQTIHSISMMLQKKNMAQKGQQILGALQV